MTELPRRPVEPLPPAPGSFDAVLGRARYRRHRRAMTAMSISAIFFAGMAGGVSLDGGVSRVQATLAGLAAVDGSSDGSDLGPIPTPNTSAVVTPDVDATRSADRVEPTSERTERTEPTERAEVAEGTDAPAEAVLALPQPAPARVNGVAVDSAGSPIAGLYVYPGQRGSSRFLATDQPVVRTAQDGTFSLRCTGTPVLLTPWRVNAPDGGAELQAGWSATFVGGAAEAASAPAAPCTTDGSAATTTILGGSSVKGTVTMPADCADARLPLWLWLHQDRSLTVRTSALTSGDSYSVAGLPPGQHTLGANGNRTTVTVGGGVTVTEDVRFACGPGSPPGTPEPTPTHSPTPLPTPSDTLTPVPTASPSPSEPDPEPSPAVSPSSSPTSTPTGSVNRS